MRVPVLLLLLLVLGTLFAVLCGVLLWSGRTQRYTRVRARELGDTEGLRVTFEGLVGSWSSEGNRVELFENGRLFDEMLRVIAAARSSVHLETYVWWRGEICRRVTDALIQKAREGVEVRLLLDALGSWTREKSLIEAMREAGVAVCLYHDVRWRSLGRLNKRDHRKLLVVDGRCGFVFGHGIAEEWEGDGDRPGSWRDLGARLEGPVVARLQSVFAENWMEEKGELLGGADYFAAPEAPGDVRVQVVASSPRGGVSASSLLYRTLSARATRRLWIANPYFVPGLDVVQLLVGVARREVDVRILVPGPHTDEPLAKWASHRVYDRLLAAGIALFEFQPTLNHQKLMIVDDGCAYLGSANFDERSFDINAEVGVVFWDEGVCRQLASVYEADLERARAVDPESWAKRARWQRLRERAAFLVHQQL